jgi:hypothetical protein
MILINNFWKWTRNICYKYKVSLCVPVNDGINVEMKHL